MSDAGAITNYCRHAPGDWLILASTDPDYLTAAECAGVDEDAMEVDIELGLEQSDGIGGVIAEQIARTVAFETEGIVDFYNNEWRVLDGGRELVHFSEINAKGPRALRTPEEGTVRSPICP